MRHMTRLMALMASLTMASLTAGCGQPVRTVTHISTWSMEDGNDYLYLAYAESEFVSRIKRCLVKEDNSIECTDQEALNKLLNQE